MFGSVLIDHAVRHPSGPGTDPAADEPASGAVPKALRTTDAGSTKPAIPAPVTGVRLASAAMLFAGALPESATGALEGAFAGDDEDAGSADEPRETLEDVADDASEPVRSLGEAAVRALDRP